jgi:hypothetical protein
VTHDPEAAAGTKAASIQQRTAMGKHKDGSIYLRSADGDDLSTVKKMADSMGLTYRQRRGGASHFGRIGSYEHLHFDNPGDAARVHASLNYVIEEDGEKVSASSNHDTHFEKLGKGLQHHVQGKDAGTDACMQNTREALRLTETAMSADSPQAHLDAANLHRLTARSHADNAGRPWTKSEGVHHAGFSYLHEEAAAHHEEKAKAAQKRIIAERKRKAEIKAKMEAMEEGRDVKKGLETCGAGTELSTLEGGGALRAEGHDEELADGTIGEDEKRPLEKAIELEQLPERTLNQEKAGNYKKHHLKVHGLDIAIENPVGSTRSGIAKDGTKWETTMKHHYGYIKRTTGADGDHVDCFVGPHEDNPYVHVINQIEPTTGEFDEHKVMIGFKGRQHAIDSYHANYQKGWKGMGECRTMHVDDFKEWLKYGDQTSRLIYKAANTRLHTASRIQMQVLRHQPGAQMSPYFTDCIQAAKTAGVSDAEILRTVSIASGAFAPLVKHLKEHA